MFLGGVFYAKKAATFFLTIALASRYAVEMQRAYELYAFCGKYNDRSGGRFGGSVGKDLLGLLRFHSVDNFARVFHPKKFEGVYVASAP
jgi:hypothetical protein